MYGTSGLIVNTALAPDVTDYTDLLDPKYEGRVSYRLKRPTLIAMGYAFGYNPFALYDDPGAYQMFLDDIEGKLIAGKEAVEPAVRPRDGNAHPNTWNRRGRGLAGPLL